MENGPFEDVFPIKIGDIPAIAMLVYQRVACRFLVENLWEGLSPFLS